MKYKIFDIDPQLKQYETDLNQRMENYKNKKKELLAPGQKLIDFANGHMFYGFHKTENGWYYREWAPAAEAVYLTGVFNNWDRHSHPLTKKENGVWELFIPGTDGLKNGQKVMTIGNVRPRLGNAFVLQITERPLQIFGQVTIIQPLLQTLHKGVLIACIFHKIPLSIYPKPSYINLQPFSSTFGSVAQSVRAAGS